uniref:Uncharacterized protein n=1 Tax=Rhizophora mucronata TaxID=61149 RepID=A0A2P2JX09_RHIMU
MRLRQAPPRTTAYTLGGGGKCGRLASDEPTLCLDNKVQERKMREGQQTH